jgi:nucleoside 2-deoxyribosyltransferase
MDKKNKRIVFHDPLEYESEDPIVYDMDIKEINNSSCIVVYIDKVTIGTMLELGYCIFKKDIPWCILTYNKKVIKHPWIVRLCKNKVFNNIERVANFINKVYSSNLCNKKKKR